jgi:uncharacterized membrane protein YadS
MSKPHPKPKPTVPLWFIITFILLALLATAILHIDSYIPLFLD